MQPHPGQVVLYGTALTKLQQNGMVFEAQAILSSGSGLTFVTERFVKKAKSPNTTSLSRLVATSKLTHLLQSFRNSVCWGGGGFYFISMRNRESTF